MSLPQKSLVKELCRCCQNPNFHSDTLVSPSPHLSLYVRTNISAFISILIVHNSSTPKRTPESHFFTSREISFLLMFSMPQELLADEGELGLEKQRYVKPEKQLMLLYL